MFGYARCSTQHQDAIYEINELIKLGVKRENIYIDFNICVNVKLFCRFLVKINVGFW